MKRTAYGLVDRIGGPERLRQILHRFYARLFVDPMVGFHFAGHDIDKIVDGQWGFLMRAFGATERFHGKNPGLAHVDLPPILTGQFDRRIVMLRESLESEGLHDEDVEIWCRVEESFRGRIVTVRSCQGR